MDFYNKNNRSLSTSYQIARSSLHHLRSPSVSKPVFFIHFGIPISDFRLPVKVTEPDRVIDFTYDPQGLLLERKETPTP